MNNSNFPKDIQNKIFLDFEKDYDEVIKLLSDFYNEMSSLNIGFESSRVVRCIIFLSNGDLNKLDHNINLAKADWRDVIVFAEYDKDDNHVRNFRNP